MIQIDQAQMGDADFIRELFSEHLEWANAMVNSEFGLNFDIPAMVASDMNELSKYLPPNGALLLARLDGQLAGTICMRPLAGDIGELKRMYVRSTFRRTGVGRALLVQLLVEARALGYAKLRLDSARFMTAAHALYRSQGFHEIDPYPGTDIPYSYQPNWVFMEVML